MPGPGAVTLATLLELRSTGLSEPEIWSLLCQAAQALQDLFLAKKACENFPRVCPSSLRVTSRGRVTLLPGTTSDHVPSDSVIGDHFLAPEYATRCGDATDVEIEKMWIYSLGQTLQQARATIQGQPTQPLADLLTSMTHSDPMCRASLLDVLDVISEFCKIRLNCKPFSHIIMDLYKEVYSSPIQGNQCLFNTTNNTLVMGTVCNLQSRSKTPKAPSIGKSFSLKEVRTVRKNPVHRAPSRLYRTASSVADKPCAKYTCPTTCIGPEFVVRASDPSKVIHLYSKKMKHSQQVTVILLDGQRLNIYCDLCNVTAKQLLEVVLQVEKIEENFYLGLTVLLDGDFFFLCSDTQLYKVTSKGWHEKNKILQMCSLTLYLRVKFFLPSLRGVCMWTTKHLLYLQLRRCLLEQQVQCEINEHIALGGLALQAEFGDYIADEHGCGDYFMLEHYVPETVLGQEELALRLELQEQHRRRRGLDPGRAEEIYIELVQRLDTYGLHFYAVTCVKKNKSPREMWLAVGRQGLAVYDKCGGATKEFLKLYVWKNVEKLCYSKQYFILYPRSDVSGVIPDKCKFQMDHNKSLFVFNLASYHHQFFLKLNAELNSLYYLSKEFGVSLATLRKENKKLFFIETQPVIPNNFPFPKVPIDTFRQFVLKQNPTNLQGSQSSVKCHLDTGNIEENQNRENEKPYKEELKEVNCSNIFQYHSQDSKEEDSCGSPCDFQYKSHTTNDSRAYKTTSFPRRHRVKMGTRAYFSTPSDLYASQRVDHIHQTTTLNVLEEVPTLVNSPSPDAYVLNSSIKSYDEMFHFNVHESLSESLINKFDEISFADERILKTIKLHKDERMSLGIEVTEGSDGGLYIQSLSAAVTTAHDGNIRPGDQLIAVDGHSLLQMNYQEALVYLQETGTEVELIISQVCLKNGDLEYMHNQENRVGSDVSVVKNSTYKIEDRADIQVTLTPIHLQSRPTSECDVSKNVERRSRSLSYPNVRSPRGIRTVCCVMPDE